MQKIPITFELKPRTTLSLTLQQDEVLFLSRFYEYGFTSCHPDEFERFTKNIERLIFLCLIKFKKGAQIIYCSLTKVGKKLIQALKETAPIEY